MDLLIIVIVLLLVTLVLGGGYIFYKLQKSGVFNNDQPQISEEQAESTAKAKIAEAEKHALEIKSEAQEEANRINKQLEERERKVEDKERKNKERSQSLDSKATELEQKEKRVEQAKADVKKLKEKAQEQLQKTADMTKEQAQEELKAELENEIKDWSAQRIRDAEKHINRETEDRARDMLVDVMQKSASDFVAETTSTTFEIADENLKGKIIGKEGRNIRSFERATGVDIIVDDAPNQVTISCFDPIRREVAALAIQKLLRDGRVHPASIEETVKNIKNDLKKEIRKTGEKIAYESGFSDLPDEIVMLLGRFKYRFSYGQNLANHSLEMVNIGAQLASELGADVRMAKLACLLHDIGKVLTHEYEGKPHHHISGDIIRKYLKDEKLANAVESHHEDIEPQSLEAQIVIIADAISGGRPGARRDTHDEYVQRISNLEHIAKQHENVSEAFALKAGREVRVLVNPDDTSDEDAKLLAYKIAKEIEDTQSYPGTVKVVTIRETRVTEEAK